MSAAHCQGIVREMSGNFIVSGEWSPCMVCVCSSLANVNSYLSCSNSIVYKWLCIYMCMCSRGTVISCLSCTAGRKIMTEPSTMPTWLVTSSTRSAVLLRLFCGRHNWPHYSLFSASVCLSVPWALNSQSKRHGKKIKISMTVPQGRSSGCANF